MTTEKTEKKAGAAAPEPEASCLTLRQKLVELRKACPKLKKETTGEGVKYKFNKIDDVWEKIVPVMNALGVDFDIIAEEATRHDENNNPIYWQTMQTKTKYGERLMFLYECDLTVKWTNLDSDEDNITVKIHCVAWNDDPAKAKGSAHTYGLKYYLFEKFCIDQGEDDPDRFDNGAEAKRNAPPPARLSDAQMERLYKKAAAVGMNREVTNQRIMHSYGKNDPTTLTYAEYDAICQSLDNAFNAQNQGGNNA